MFRVRPTPPPRMANCRGEITKSRPPGAEIFRKSGQSPFLPGGQSDNPLSPMEGGGV